MKIFVILLIGLSALILACAGGEDSPAPDSMIRAITGEKVFRTNSPKPRTLDPQQCNDVGCARFIDEIYSGLLTLVLVPKQEAELYAKDHHGLPMLTGEVMEQMPSLWQKWAKTYLREQDSMAIALAPDIAKEVPESKYNSDGTVSYTFELRRNVFFHNGKHMTAHDFKFSFERAASGNWPDRFSVFTIPNADLYLSDIVGVRERMFNKEGVEEVSGVEVLGDYTLRITIDAPKSYFLWKLTYPTAFVIDKDKIIDPITGEVQKEDWTDPPNGTGPFSAVPGNEETVLAANSNFYLGRPYLDKIVFNHQGGQSTIFAYDAGEVDITGVGTDYLPRTKPEHEKYDPEFAKQYRSGPLFDIWYVVFNTEKPPFDDPDVRRAFAMALDTEELNVIGEGLFTPAESIIPPGITGYDQDLRGIPFDPKGAEELLKGSRYWGTEELKSVEFIRGGSGPEAGSFSEAILGMWRKHIEKPLGISIIVDEPATGGVYQNRVTGGDYEIAIAGWVADYPDPEDFLDLKLYCNRITDPITGKERCERDYANNHARYYNPEFDRLLEEARIEQDLEKRIALYQEAQRIAINDVPWIPLVHSRNSIAIKPHVSGYYPAPMVIPIFRFIDIVE